MALRLLMRNLRQKYAAPFDTIAVQRCLLVPREKEEKGKSMKVPKVVACWLALVMAAFVASSSSAYAGQPLVAGGQIRIGGGGVGISVGGGGVGISIGGGYYPYNRGYYQPYYQPRYQPPYYNRYQPPYTYRYQPPCHSPSLPYYPPVRRAPVYVPPYVPFPRTSPGFDYNDYRRQELDAARREQQFLEEQRQQLDRQRRLYELNQQEIQEEQAQRQLRAEQERQERDFERRLQEQRRQIEQQQRLQEELERETQRRQRQLDDLLLDPRSKR